MAQTFATEPVVFLGDDAIIEVQLDDHEDYPVVIRPSVGGVAAVCRLYLSSDAADHLYRQLQAYCEDLSRLADTRYVLPPQDLAQIRKEQADGVG